MNVINDHDDDNQEIQVNTKSKVLSKFYFDKKQIAAVDNEQDAKIGDFVCPETKLISFKNLAKLYNEISIDTENKIAELQKTYRGENDPKYHEINDIINGIESNVKSITELIKSDAAVSDAKTNRLNSLLQPDPDPPESDCECDYDCDIEYEIENDIEFENERNLYNNDNNEDDNCGEFNGSNNINHLLESKLLYSIPEENENDLLTEKYGLNDLICDHLSNCSDDTNSNTSSKSSCSADAVADDNDDVDQHRLNCSANTSISDFNDSTSVESVTSPFYSISNSLENIPEIQADETDMSSTNYMVYLLLFQSF